MSIVLLALDPATRTGVAIGRPNETPKLFTMNFGLGLDSATDIGARAITWLDRALSGALDIGMEEPLGAPTHLAVETPIPPSAIRGFTNHKTMELTQGLGFAFRSVASARGIPIIEAPINSWRKYVLGKVNLNGTVAKQAMVKMCRGLGWGGEKVDQDAAEAAGIWVYACGQLQIRKWREENAPQ